MINSNVCFDYDALQLFYFANFLSNLNASDFHRIFRVFPAYAQYYVPSSAK